MKSVHIYTLPGCDACARAIALLQDRNLPFHDLDASDLLTRDELKRRLPGVTRVPQIFVGIIHVGGLDELERLSLAHLQQMIAE